MDLYPLKFKTIYKDKIWGGTRIKDILGKDFSPLRNCGESWELSGVEGDVSEVVNGFLEGNTLEELIEIYMGDLVGETVYEKFGLEFPILIKFIDSNDWLSIQVHPDDKLAMSRHNSFGKNEMWYIMHAEKDAQIISGFNQQLDKAKYLQHFNAGSLKDIVNFVPAKKGDVFDMPTGRVHALGPGLLLAEIQQTSDITYRIYDWDRVDSEGNTRALHTELAVDAIDFSFLEKANIDYQLKHNNKTELVSNKYFKTNILHFEAPLALDYSMLDSFVIYICIEGEAIVQTGVSDVTIKLGETVLIPAMYNAVNLLPAKESKILEVYIENTLLTKEKIGEN